jgi:hypothetical protein
VELGESFDGVAVSISHLASTRVAVPGAALAAVVLSLSGLARAEEPRKVTEPPVLRETAEVTSVADAFDDDDRFDLHLSLGFEQTWTSGKILRETNSDLPQFSSGGFVAGNMPVATYKETTSRLNTRADIGLYKDLALIIRLPIILSNDRKLSSLNGSGSVQSVAIAGAPGEQLFSLPFESPTRSGIEYLAIGLDSAVMNQQRDRTKPTWVIGLEGRFSVSEPMHACSKNRGVNIPGDQQQCADPSDINRDGIGGQVAGPGGTTLDGSTFSGGRKPGVGRGTTGLYAHTFISKRVKYIEPYAGLDALFEFQTDGSDYGSTDLRGSLVNHPPYQGSFMAGAAVVPWEIRDQFQKVEIDVRGKATYRSEGRDYSPLFDAIGSSDAPSLRRPNFSTYQNDVTTAARDSVVNPNSTKVYTTGITDVQQHGIYTISGQFTFQAGEYVKFNLGTAFTLIQGHLLTFDQPCNPDITNDLGAAGPCRTTSSSGTPSATGIPNPNYRAAIDSAGRRFRLDDATSWDAWVNAIVMF